MTTSSSGYDDQPDSPTLFHPAGSPFNDVDADLTIRSSDNVEFHVHKVILAKASRTFRDMFALPPPMYSSSQHPEDDYKDGRLVVHLSENSSVLDMMFRLFYPVDSPKITSIVDIRAVLRALDKYLVDGFPETIENILMGGIEREPQTICVIACRYDLPKVANAAAKLTLRDLILYSGPYPSDEDLSYISAAKYRRLLLYHQQCSERAAAVVQSLLWMDGRSIPSAVEDGSSPPPGCTCSRGEKWAISRYGRKRGSPNGPAPTISMYKVTDWVTGYLRRCERGLRDRPHWETVLEDRMLTPFIKMAEECMHCERTAVDLQMHKFSQLLADKIRSAIEQVPLPF